MPCILARMQADPTEHVLRTAYSAVLHLLVPVTAYHLIWRGFRQPEYFQRWNERYAAYRQAAQPRTVWIHAVSVGEVNAAAPLVDALLTRRPDLPLLVTCVTPTGSARIRALWGERVQHVYLPYDLPGMVRRFLRHFRPQLALILETELWPNLLFGCREEGIPVHIVNARLSARSLRGYQVLLPLLSRALAGVRKVLAQSVEDGKRFVQLGAPRLAVAVTGNLKHDMAVDPKTDAFAAQFRGHAGERLAWIAASTHPDEEAAVIGIHRRLRQRWPNLLLLWAPRHPERFRAAIQQGIDAGWKVATRQLTRSPSRDDDVFVIDTLGELPLFYACADAAFVGGSLQPIGGHNLLEPAAVGCPVVTGPHLHNFTDIARQLRQVHALLVADDADGVGKQIEHLLSDADLRARMATAGKALVQAGRGALQRTWDEIADDLPGDPSLG